MGVNIVLDNINVGGGLDILNDANISSRADSNIEIHNLFAKGNSIMEFMRIC